MKYTVSYLGRTDERAREVGVNAEKVVADSPAAAVREFNRKRGCSIHPGERYHVAYDVPESVIVETVAAASDAEGGVIRMAI